MGRTSGVSLASAAVSVDGAVGVLGIRAVVGVLSVSVVGRLNAVVGQPAVRACF